MLIQLCPNKCITVMILYYSLQFSYAQNLSTVEEYSILLGNTNLIPSANNKAPLTRVWDEYLKSNISIPSSYKLAENFTDNFTRKGNARTFTSRPKTARREKHRHSTLVRTLKPSMILLPPFGINRRESPRKGSRQSRRKIAAIKQRDQTIINNQSEIITTTESSRFVHTVAPPLQILVPPLPQTFISYDTTDYVNRNNQSENSQKPLNQLLPDKESFQTTKFVFDLFDETTESIIVSKSDGDIIEDVKTNRNNFPIVSEYPVNLPMENFVLNSYYANSSTKQDSIHFNEEENLTDFIPWENNLLKNYTDQPENVFPVETTTTGVFTTSQDYSFNLFNDTSEKETLITADFGDIRNEVYRKGANSLKENSEHKNANMISRMAKKKISKPKNRSYKVCMDKLGYVADVSSGCKMFYICIHYGVGELMSCPNGTLFNQDFLVCDWWYNVECA